MFFVVGMFFNLFFNPIENCNLFTKLYILLYHNSQSKTSAHLIFLPNLKVEI